MNQDRMMQILQDTAFPHTSGTEKELQVAEYLLRQCEALGASAHLEPFDVEMSTMKYASLQADGQPIPCEGYKLCGSGSVEAPFIYLPNTDRASLKKAKGKIVLLDTRVGYWIYRDLLEAGAVGFITFSGDVLHSDRDIDSRELRPAVSCGSKIPGVNLHAEQARQLVTMAPKMVKITVEQDEWVGQSHNVVATLQGEIDECIVLSAHYDTSPLSVGSYDNMTGCIGLIGVMEYLSQMKPHYSVRFVFCGSEQRGLLGSKAYTQAHESELESVALNINLDMIGSTMGRFLARVSAEEKLVAFIEYFAAMRGWGISASAGVYSSDSTPFADHGVPALTFARMTPPGQGAIHTRYDTTALLSCDQLARDIDFIADFTSTMANATFCPVSRTIPEKVKTALDEYLFRKRKD